MKTVLKKEHIVLKGSPKGTFCVDDLKRTLLYSGMVAGATAVMEVIAQDGLNWRSALKMILTSTITGLMIAIRKYFSDTREISKESLQ
jgi:hypothetical protein